MSKKFKKSFAPMGGNEPISRPVGTSSEADSEPIVRKRMTLQQQYFAGIVGTENEPSGETKYASLRASEDLKKVQEELKNELKKSVSERPKGSNKSKKALPIEVKTPFGRGYFVDDLPDGVPVGAKITLYRGKKFMLKSEKA